MSDQKKRKKKRIFGSASGQRTHGSTSGQVNRIPTERVSDSRGGVPSGSKGDAAKKRGRQDRYEDGRKISRREYRKRRRKKHKLRRRIILLCIIAFLVVAFIVGYKKIHPLYVEAQNTMYELLADMDEGTFKRSSNTVVYDADDNVVGKVGYENYEYVDITDISMYIQNGYIAVEDQNFTTHHGVDILATIRAAIALVRNNGEITQGGSTITQQVVKNNLLSQERTYERKIMEILLAFQIEKHYTKTDIMEYYCNSNYYGNSCYGVEGAAQYYFGKSAADVTLGEAAMLVATSNSPNNYNPVVDYKLCIKKKKQVLKAMLEQGMITEEQYETARKERPTIVQQVEEADSENYMTTYAIHCAALKLMELQGFAFMYTFEDQDTYTSYTEDYETAYDNAVQTIRDGGYTIKTSLDQDIQDSLQAAVDETLADETALQEDGSYDLQAAAMCIDNETGMVVAIVGGRGEDGSYNRGYQAERQPGSSIKPLYVYGPALNEGMLSPATTYTDQAIDIDGYTPENSGGSYYGTVTIREALARSLNTVAVQVLYNNGISTALSYLDGLEFSTLSFADQYNLSTALGGFTNGVTVEDMAKGYATIANGGTYRDNTCILSVTSETDGVLYSYTETEEQVYSEDTAFMLTDMMQGVFNESYGTAHSYANEDQVYAGKTGTTNSSKDAWFAGFSAYYTTVTWVGCDTPKTVSGLYGNGYPLQIWSTFMDELHEDLDKKEFEVPSTILLQNSKGKTKAVTYTEDIYDSRPNNWDYISSLLIDQVEENEEKQLLQSQLNAAETAVSEFEDFQIDSGEDALELDERYNSVLAVIEEISDTSEQVPYKERAAYKYGLLSDEVVEIWQDELEEAEEAAQEEKNIANAEAAQESVETALAKIEELRVNTVQNYIDAINARTVYTDTVESLYQSALTALARCADYDSYDTLDKALEKAITAARQLPTEEEVEADSVTAQQLYNQSKNAS